MKPLCTEKELIEYVKPYLKAKGFKKNNKRWIKRLDDFTLCFYIQGSCYSKENYYIRPSVFINDLSSDTLVYGHFVTQIEQTTPDEILCKFENWCEEWTDRTLIKERLLMFLDWEKRNSLEKRRANLVDYEKDPVPAVELLMIDLQTKQYILDNY